MSLVRIIFQGTKLLILSSLLRFQFEKIFKVQIFKICNVRESNPGLPRGRREFYHWTNVAWQPELKTNSYIELDWLKSLHRWTIQIDSLNLSKLKFIWLCTSRFSSNVGSVVEFSPATREARVRFPDVANFAKFSIRNINYYKGCSRVKRFFLGNILRVKDYGKS